METFDPTLPTPGPTPHSALSTPHSALSTPHSALKSVLLPIDEGIQLLVKFLIGSAMVVSFFLAFYLSLSLCNKIYWMDWNKPVKVTWTPAAGGQVAILNNHIVMAYPLPTNLYAPNTVTTK